MNIESVDITKVRRDPNQPRTIFNEDQIEGMAKSIITEGVINPVETDKDLMIVTGEMRWRAAKLAGLKVIPVKIIEVTPDNRFRRQFIENVHHQTMTVLDTARALAKMLNLPPGGKFELQQGKDYGIEKLAKEIGMSGSWISEQLAYLNEDQEVLEYLATPDAKSTYIREINRHAPEDLKQPLKVKVTAGEIKDRETINEVIRAVKRKPEKREEILNLDLSGKMPENMNRIQLISPAIEIPVVVESEEEIADRMSNRFDNYLTNARSLMAKINLEELMPVTLAMLFANNTEFMEPFAIFTHKVKALLDRKKLESGGGRAIE